MDTFRDYDIPFYCSGFQIMLCHYDDELCAIRISSSKEAKKLKIWRI